MMHKGKMKWTVVLPVAGLGLAYLLLLGYLLLGNLLGLRSAATAASPAPTPEPVDLWDAYEQARAAARAQAQDAQLVSASTQWQTVSKGALSHGARNWTFVFYSPGDSRSLDVVVNAGVARVASQTQAWVVPSVLPESAWQTGPSDVLLAFLACGGRTFLDEHPHAAVDLHLARDRDGGPTWTVVALDVGDRSLLSMMVDAGTGQVLSVDSPETTD